MDWSDKAAAMASYAKQAHDTLLLKVYRAQADALLIEAGAKSRLADEYDAAQDRGDISKQGSHLGDGKVSTSDLGLRYDQIHEARQICDAEQRDPSLAGWSI